MVKRDTSVAISRAVTHHNRAVTPHSRAILLKVDMADIHLRAVMVDILPRVAAMAAILHQEAMVDILLKDMLSSHPKNPEGSVRQVVPRLDLAEV